MLVPKLRFKREDGTDYSEWKSLMLGEKFTFKNGLNASREAFRTEGIHCIGVSDVFKCLPIIADNIIGTVAVSDDEIEKSKVDYGDILFQRSSETQEDIGHASVYIDNTPSVYNGFVICAKPDKLFYNPLYLHYSLQNSRIRKQTVSLGAGAQHYNIGQDGLAQIIVVFPCHEEQQKIADFLSTVDKVIVQSEAEVKNFENQKKAVMQKIFSQEVRFKREDGTEYPEWEEKRLSYCFESRDTKQVPTDEAPLMAFIAYQGVADKGERYDRSYLVKTEDKKYKRTEYNDFIYSSNNLDVGSIGLNKYGTAVISVVYEIFRIKETAIPDFINALVQTPDNMYKIIQYRQGCLYGQYKIFADDFLSVKTTIPCLEEQQKIADFLSAYDEAISYAKQELAKWKELKKGLLQQMFV